MDNNEKEKSKSELLVVTGLSGAGKSLVIQCLEDMGYFCVDNLPPVLLPKFVELMEQGNPSLRKVAIAIDLRGKELFNSLVAVVDKVKSESDVIIDVMFLEASTEKLISRYDEEFETFTINVTSFGFKHGIQMDADLVFDVRFLPNPYYVVDLRPLTGLDKDVYNYVMKWKETEIFFEKLTDLLDFMIPGYKKEGKSQLVIAIGCTGGQHRSVALAERLGNYLNEVFEYNVYVHHRDAHIESGEKK
ncbi:ATP-binding protein UPF0042%2C contains P-loop [Staphylococcus aureus]|uniref:RapZ family nucleotide-binding protein n=1 Tax=Staphylococcus aureus TaxID=1280 RepID=UPI000768E909|nr:RNase adapter RapZ [Staphylococcus aureus]CXJ07782.1 ATP-binding protein UPF0042%2C contains P-loop [Staphylococcus aureus]